MEFEFQGLREIDWSECAAPPTSAIPIWSRARSLGPTSQRQTSGYAMRWRSCPRLDRRAPFLTRGKSATLLISTSLHTFRAEQTARRSVMTKAAEFRKEAVTVALCVYKPSRFDLHLAEWIVCNPELATPYQKPRIFHGPSQAYPIVHLGNHYTSAATAVAPRGDQPPDRRTRNC